jgi:hypothetical protein
MREVQRQRALRIVAMVGSDAGGGAADRFASVRADRKARAHGAVVETDRDAGVVRLDRHNDANDAPELRQGRGAALERGNEMAVLDIVAEGFKTDLGRFEQHLGRAQEPGGVVDQADRGQRRGMAPAQWPDLQRLERRHGAGQQRRGARVRRRRPGDERGLDARRRERDRGRQPGGPAADDRNLRHVFDRCHARPFPIDFRQP